MNGFISILVQAPPALFWGRFRDGKHVVYGLPARIIGLTLLSMLFLPLAGMAIFGKDAMVGFILVQWVSGTFISILLYLMFREKYNPDTDPTLPQPVEEVDE